MMRGSNRSLLDFLQSDVPSIKSERESPTIKQAE
jgi:hypothetical protein